MTIQIGNYKVKIQAEDKILTDMPKDEATKYFLNELSVVFDRAADYMEVRNDISDGIRIPAAGVYRRISNEIYETLIKKGFYGDEKNIV